MTVLTAWGHLQRERSPSTSMTSRQPCSAIAQSRTTAPTSCCMSTTRAPDASSCGTSPRTSTPPPSGGRQASPGSRSRSPTRVWKRLVYQKRHCRAFPKRSEWGWPRAHTNSATTAQTTRELGTEVSQPSGTHRCHCLQRVRGHVAAHDGNRTGALRGIERDSRLCPRRTSAPSLAT